MSELKTCNVLILLYSEFSLKLRTQRLSHITHLATMIYKLVGILVTLLLVLIVVPAGLLGWAKESCLLQIRGAVSWSEFSTRTESQGIYQPIIIYWILLCSYSLISANEERVQRSLFPHSANSANCVLTLLCVFLSLRRPFMGLAWPNLIQSYWVPLRS